MIFKAYEMIFAPVAIHYLYFYTRKIKNMDDENAVFALRFSWNQFNFKII